MPGGGCAGYRQCNLPLSYSGVQPLPVAVLDGVVIVEVLLLVLLDCGGRSWLIGRENVCCHLLLLFALQGDDFVADRRQLGAAAGVPLFGALTGLTLH